MWPRHPTAPEPAVTIDGLLLFRQLAGPKAADQAAQRILTGGASGDG